MGFQISQPSNTLRDETRGAVLEDPKILQEISFLDRERINDLQQNREERKLYAKKLFQLIIGWLIAIGLILFAQGMGYLVMWKFSLSEAVVLALIGGTTINVLGLFLVVVKYLFKSE